MSRDILGLTFTMDLEGRITKWHGEPIPSGIVQIVGESNVCERAPSRDSDWVMQGAYDFARRVGVPLADSRAKLADSPAESK